MTPEAVKRIKDRRLELKKLQFFIKRRDEHLAEREAGLCKSSPNYMMMGILIFGFLLVVAFSPIIIGLGEK